ncbi:hypothetical protein Phpb_02003 [Photorhabdus namnaonensis]|uniref:Uncharacterized protein n=1 Tax=Photorhabdus namnaonensis TaxID=1851568 RepID=A0A1B8YIF4_9GAMM|nr:hypothetical protein Phpb_02003 [Photorhabdus namnaonensis]
MAIDQIAKIGLSSLPVIYYFENLFSVEVFRIDTPIIPESRKSLRVVNTGIANSVTAKFYWSHSFTSEWFESGSIDVGLGEEKVLNVPSNSFYYSKFVIYNNTDKVAYVTANLV